jgi:hypothetical protein
LTPLITCVVVDLSTSQVFFPARRTLFNAFLDPDALERVRLPVPDFLAGDFDRAARVARFFPVPLADFLVGIGVSAVE